MATKKGIDVSFYQLNIDFTKVAKEIDFVIIREGYRRVVDSRFFSYVNGFRNAGVPIHGVYHFIYGTTKEEVLAEAKNCIKNVESAGLPKTCRIWADLEYDTIKSASKNGITYTKEMINEYTEVFLEYVKSKGYPVGIYLNNDYYQNYYRKDILDKYDIWLADYTGCPDHDCLYQQYGIGRVTGISTDVDLNYYFGAEEVTSNIISTTKSTMTTNSLSTIEVSETAEKAIQWMELLAKDDSHGYDQTYRWGERGDYDCSSAVISAWESAGIPVKSKGGATYTGNMYDVFVKYGFKDVTNSVNLSTGSGLIRGDVLLNHARHVAMYCGNGFEVEASINERGGISGGSPGDQTGKEILVRNYRNYPWNAVLRYPSANNGCSKNPTCLGAVDTPNTTKTTSLKLGSTGDEVKNLQKKLIDLGYNLKVTGKFTERTERKVKHFQKKYGLKQDGIVGSETSNKINEILKLSSASNDCDEDNKNNYNMNMKLYTVKVTADILNVRKGPGADYPKIDGCPQLYEGEEADVYDIRLAESNGRPWYYVKIADTFYGYISAGYTERVCC